MMDFRCDDDDHDGYFHTDLRNDGVSIVYFQRRMKTSTPKSVTDGYFSADGTEQDMTRAV
jgi:hypothetical protein